MTTSNDMQLHALEVMKTRFGRKWTTEYAGLFDRAFESLTDDQVRLALEHMLDSYTYHDPMSPAEFKAWGGIREVDSEKQSFQPFMFTAPESHKTQPFVELLAEGGEQSNGERDVPRLEGKERLRSILAMKAGQIANPLTAFERGVIQTTPDSRHPDIIEIRNRQRAALGWQPVP